MKRRLYLGEWMYLLRREIRDTSRAKTFDGLMCVTMMFESFLMMMRGNYSAVIVDAC
jgi:hypothetical protein